MSEGLASKYAIDSGGNKASLGGEGNRTRSRVAVKQTKNIPTEGAYHDPLPTVVTKKASSMSKSIKSKAQDGGSTWGEEAQKLSNMVRAKYSSISGDSSNITQNQLKLLYMIHQYSYSSSEQQNDECWIRRVPVLVLLYEGIVSQVFDYDYAPSLEVFQANRVYMNITQEGKDDIDDLRQQGMIEALTLASSEYDQCLAYTTKRANSDPVLAKMNPDWKDEVDSLLLSPNKHKTGSQATSSTWTRDDRLLEVFWNESRHIFEIVSHSGYQRVSTITEIEDVSYVCSPSIPDCLRPRANVRGSSGGDLQRNIKIAEHAVEFIKTHASDNIQDALDEVLKANGMKILVAEWIPFGSNQMANLNDKLGCVERVQGGLFSAFLDDMPEGTRFEHVVSNTGHMIKILDYNLTEFVNFTADIFFEEDEGIIQIEEFGVSVQKDGSIMYGLHVESVLDRLYKNISMDHLSRLLVDIIQDSSHVSHNLLSAYQRTMLNVLYSDRPTLRPKYRILMCEELDPMIVAEKYMDKEDFENEIKQVIGDTRSGHDLGPREVIIFGRDGLLVAGKRVNRLDSVLVSYSQLEARDTVLRSFFRRTFQLADVIKETRKIIVNYEKDPGSMRRTRTLLTKTERDLILLKELLQYISQSITQMSVPAPPDPNDAGAVELAKLIQFSLFQTNLSDRTDDMFKNIDGLQTSMKALYMLTDANAEAEMFRMVQMQVINGKNLEDTMKAGERSSSSLEVMNGILAGSLAFDIVDRISTLYMNGVPAQLTAALYEESLSGDEIPFQAFWAAWVYIGRIPGGWFLLNMLIWFLLFSWITNKMRTLADNANGALQCRLTVNTKIHMDKLEEYLAKKRLMNEDSDNTKHLHTRTVSWQENNPKEWKGKAPLVEIHYDVKNEFLLMVALDVEQNYGTWTEKALRVRCKSELNLLALLNFLSLLSLLNLLNLLNLFNLFNLFLCRIKHHIVVWSVSFEAMMIIFVLLTYFYLFFPPSVFSMFAQVGILESSEQREPWNDLSRPIYERLQLRQKAQGQSGEMSATLLEQLSSQRDATQESSEDISAQRERRNTTKNFFSGMELEDLEDEVKRLPSMM